MPRTMLDVITNASPAQAILVRAWLRLIHSVCFLRIVDEARSPMRESNTITFLVFAASERSIVPSKNARPSSKSSLVQVPDVTEHARAASESHPTERFSPYAIFASADLPPSTNDSGGCARVL